MRELRHKAGKTLKDLAESMDLSAMYLSDLERGERNWTFSLGERYMAALKNGKK